MKIDEIEEGDLISETFNNGRGVDWKPLTEENWEKELEDVPLFMSTAPTADKMENNDALQAIHSLVYDGTPEEIAANFKEQANEIVREKDRQNYHAAIAYYTKALGQRCSDLQLNISCLLNRAQVNLELENYGSAIRDCQAAVRMGGGQEKMDQKCLTKALFRLCKGFLALDKLDESRSALDYGKNIDPRNAVWTSLENQLKQRKEELTRRTAKRELDGRVKQQRNEKLLAAIRSRSINIAGGVDKAKFIVDPNAAESPPVIAVSPAMLFPLPDEVVYNMRPALCQDMNGVEEGGLQWPVCFIYPQMETYDLVSDWHESTSVRDQLDQVLHGRDDFPAELRVQYSASSELAVYYPNLLQSRGWKRVPPLASLEAILAGGCPIAEDGIVRLWVMPKPIRNGWTTQWIAKHSIA